MGTFSYVTDLIYEPAALAVDQAGNLYVADPEANAIYEVKPSALGWAVTNIAGGGGSFGSKDGIGTNAQFEFPTGVAVDAESNIYVADYGNFLIRKITPMGTNWVVSTIGGLAGTLGSADGTGANARFNVPRGVAVDSAGAVYVADYLNNTTSERGSSRNSTRPYPLALLPPPMTGRLQGNAPAAGKPMVNTQRFPLGGGLASQRFATATNLTARQLPGQFSQLARLWLAIPPGLSITNPVVRDRQYHRPRNQLLLSPPPYSIGHASASATPAPSRYISEPTLPSEPVGGFSEDTNAFFASDYTTNLMSGTYLIEFAGPFSGRASPPTASVQVFSGQPTLISVSYPFAAAPPDGVLLPSPVPANEINDLTDYPFGFNGQIQSDVGYGSGVAVQTNVVLTAAHLVFNDETLGYVSGAYWFLQQESSFLRPKPIVSTRLR